MKKIATVHLYLLKEIKIVMITLILLLLRKQLFLRWLKEKAQPLYRLKLYSVQKIAANES